MEQDEQEGKYLSVIDIDGKGSESPTASFAK